jgi:hypothetical protein
LVSALSASALAADPEAAKADPASAEPAPATAEPAASKPAPAAPKEEGIEPADQKFGHGRQFMLRAGIVGGYRMIFRYDKSPFCHTPDPTKGDKDQQKFCGNGAPLAVDLGLGFGALETVEPFIWARFGFAGEGSTNTNPILVLGAGARIYTNSDSKFKVFVEPAVAAELEGGAGSKLWQFQDGTKPDYKTDFLFHLGVGPQYDFARAFGAYLNFGITTGVVRYIHTELEANLGVQLRVP